MDTRSVGELCLCLWPAVTTAEGRLVLLTPGHGGRPLLSVDTQGRILHESLPQSEALASTPQRARKDEKRGPMWRPGDPRVVYTSAVFVYTFENHTDLSTQYSLLSILIQHWVRLIPVVAGYLSEKVPRCSNASRQWCAPTAQFPRRLAFSRDTSLPLVLKLE